MDLKMMSIIICRKERLTGITGQHDTVILWSGGIILKTRVSKKSIFATNKSTEKRKKRVSLSFSSLKLVKRQE